MTALLARTDPARIAHGELALVALAAVVAREDFETFGHADRLERARAIAGRLPPGGVLLDPVRLFDVCDRLDRLAAALEQLHNWPSGDPDWREASLRQASLGRAVAKALEALAGRAVEVFDGQAPALWRGGPAAGDNGCGPNSPADPPGGLSPDPTRRAPVSNTRAGGGHPGSAANVSGQSGGGGAGGGRDPRKVSGRGAG